MSIKKKIAKKVLGVIKKPKADPRVESAGAVKQLDRMDDSAAKGFKRKDIIQEPMYKITRRPRQIDVKKYKNTFK